MRNKRAIPANHGKSNLRILAGNLSKNPLLEADEKWRRFDKNGLKLSVECKHSKDLTESELKFITDLTESTMHEFYEHSEYGWNRKAKEKEFKHETARILLVRDESEKLVAFVHFRFELDDEQKFPVVYCYEIQMPPEVQGANVIFQYNRSMIAFSRVTLTFDPFSFLWIKFNPISVSRKRSRSTFDGYSGCHRRAVQDEQSYDYVFQAQPSGVRVLRETRLRHRCLFSVALWGSGQKL